MRQLRIRQSQTLADPFQFAVRNNELCQMHQPLQQTKPGHPKHTSRSQICKWFTDAFDNVDPKVAKSPPEELA